MGLFKPTWQSKNKRKAEKAVDKINNQKTLEEIAKSNVWDCVRAKAIKKLTDKNVLIYVAEYSFGVVKNSANERLVELRKAEVSALTDQTELVRVAKNDKDWVVRKTAIDKVNDSAIVQELYIYNTIHGETYYERKQAMNKLTSQDALAQVVKNLDNWGLYEKAFEKLNDQTILADIANAKYVKAEYVRIAAAKKLADQDLAQKVYADVAKNAINAEVRKRAAEELSDTASNRALVQKCYTDVVKNSETWHDCQRDFEKLAGQAVFADIAKNAVNSYVAKMAAEKLTDPSLLAEVVKRSEHHEAQYIAVSKLNDQTVLADMVSKVTDPSIRKAAVERLTVQSVIADIARNDEDDSVRGTAVEKLTDQTALAFVVKNEERDGYISLLAAKNMTDQSLAQEAYAYIAKHDFYPGNVIKYANTAYGPLMVAVGNLANRTLLADVAKNAKYTKIRIEAMKKAGILCDTNEHQWVEAGQCRKKCTVCGVGIYDHDYKQTYYDGSGAEVSVERCKCTKCGHEGWASGYSSELQKDYFLE